MIEAMEQQIINAINNRWRKDRDKRIEIDIDKVSECFRVICSSRNSTLSIINLIKQNGISNELLNKLNDNMTWIYSWFTKDSIDRLYKKYTQPLKDKKKENLYLLEVNDIKLYLQEFQTTLIDTTINKLFLFHNIK